MTGKLSIPEFIYQGACKRPGQLKKEEEKKPNREKSERSCQSRRWQAPEAVEKRKKNPKKNQKKIVPVPIYVFVDSCLYMFLTTQSKKPNLRRRLNHIPINQIV